MKNQTLALALVKLGLGLCILVSPLNAEHEPTENTKGISLEP